MIWLAQRAGRVSDVKKYLAYGANMDLNVMARRCPKAKFLGVGLLQDWRLMFKGEMPHSYATIEPWEGYQVPFVLWNLTPSDERELDRFEGYPIHYQKRIVTVDFDLVDIEAMIYQKPEKEETNPPMQHYLEALKKSYEYHSFEDRILKAAVEFSSYRPWDKQ